MIVISDFLDEGVAEQVRLLAVDHHVLAVEIADRLDCELPDVGRITFVDPETGRCHRVHTGSSTVRDAFAEAAQAQRQELETSLRSAGAGPLRLDTGSNWLAHLVEELRSDPLTQVAPREVAG